MTTFSITDGLFVPPPPRREVLPTPLKLRLQSDALVTVDEISTTNPHKLSEFIAAGLELKELSLSPEIEEVQANDSQLEKLTRHEFTYVAREIAARKAEKAYYMYNRPVLVEDTILFVYALPTQVGINVKSWAYNNESLNDLCLMTRLKRNMNAVAVSTLAVSNGRYASAWHGEMEGIIPDEPRGTNGHGFDSGFVPEPNRQLLYVWPGSRELKTWAEMLPEEKMAYFSIRARTVEALAKSVVD